jgi:hypothetical protein
VSITLGKAREVFCILQKVLSLSPKSVLALCLRQVPVTPTQPPGCPGHQGNILALVGAQSCPGLHSAFCKGPFLTLVSDSQPRVGCWLRDGRAPHPDAAGTRQWDVSPLRRGSPLSLRQQSLPCIWVPNC